MGHIFLHFLVPALPAILYGRKKYLRVYLILMATMLVDVDHVFATPIYDPLRCSVGFHPLHAVWLTGVYFVLCFLPKTRLIGVGLTIHMLLDSLDCRLTNGVWFV